MTNSSSELPPARERGTSPYARFIPREELKGFASWSPGNLDLGGSASHGGPAASSQAATPTPEQWLARVEAVRRQAQQEGYENGYRDGLAALEGFKQTLTQQSAAQVGALLKSLQSEFDQLQPQLAATVAQVAVDLARQVLRTELRQHPEVVVEVARQALQSVVLGARHLTLHLHPDDLPLVQQGVAELLQSREAALQADASLRRGNLRLHSDAGCVEACVEDRWRQATAHLMPGGTPPPLAEEA